MPARLAPTLCFVLLGVLLSVLRADGAHAQLRQHTLWLVEESEGGSDADRAYEDELIEIFGTSYNDEHVVGVRGVARLLEQQGLPIPMCFDGTAPCQDLSGAMLDALNIGVVVSLRPQPDGSVDATAHDSTFTEIQRLHAEGDSTRDAMLRAVAELTGATGTLEVRSEPEGATVLLDGREVGVTPLRRTLAVGAYDMEIALPGWVSISDRVEIAPNSTVRRSATMIRRQATLIVRSGTPGAEVRVEGDDNIYGLDEEILVEPGERSVSVEAPGYDTLSSTYRFTPGQEREVTATLMLSHEELTRRRIEEIRQRPLMLQVGLHYGRFGSDWRNGRAADAGGDIECAIRPTTGVCERATANAVGLNLELSYAWRYLEVQPLGLSIRALAMQDAAVDYRIEDLGSPLSHVRARRVQLRLAHVGARHLFTEYIEVYARGGLSLVFDRIVAEDLLDALDEERRAYRRTGLQFEARGGIRFHINQLLYAYGELGVGFELLHRGTKPALGVSLGAGVNLPSPFAPPQSDSASTPGSESLPAEL